MWISERKHYEMRTEIEALKREVKILREYYGFNSDSVVNFLALEKPIMITREFNNYSLVPMTVITYDDVKTQLRIHTTDNQHLDLVAQFKADIAHV